MDSVSQRMPEGGLQASNAALAGVRRNASNADLAAVQQNASRLRARYHIPTSEHTIQVGAELERMCVDDTEEHSSKDAYILYGAGIDVTESDPIPISPCLDLTKLKTVLDIRRFVSDREPLLDPTPGVDLPKLYVSSCYSSSPIHIEDYALFGINYHHFGAPVVW